MSKIFTRTYCARYSDINADGQLSPADYARYIIDTAYDWGATLGLGYSDSEALGLYWVILENEIQIFEPLHFKEEFDFTIWMLEWKRVRGTRAFVVKHKDTGVTVAQGIQQIACMDSKTQRPASPPAGLIENFRLEAPQMIPSQRFSKIQVLPEKSFSHQIRVAWQDLDILEMVNNAVYIGYAEEAVTQLLSTIGWSPVEMKSLGLARSVHRVHIQYHSPAIWGETLDLKVHSLELDRAGGSFYVGMRRLANGAPMDGTPMDGTPIASCVLDWGLRDRGSREARPLPEAMLNRLKDAGK